MIEPSPEAAVQEQGGGLQQKLDHLEEYWDSRKAELKGRKTTLPPKQSPSPSSSSSGKNRGMVENSPRSLMASLQLGVGSSPAAGRWKVRTNDLAVEEVLMERRAAIVEGRLKGRRLFHDDDDQPEAEEGISGDGGGWGFADFVYCYDSHCDIGGGYQNKHKGQGKEGGGVSPDSSSSSSFVCDECLAKAAMDVGRKDREDTTTTTTTQPLLPAKYDKRWSSSSIAASPGRTWTVLMVCLAIGFIVVARGFISIRRCCRGIDEYSDQVPVPT